MNKASKLAKQLHEKISKIFPQVIDCKKFLKSVKNPNKTIFITIIDVKTLLNSNPA